MSVGYEQSRQNGIRYTRVSKEEYGWMLRDCLFSFDSNLDRKNRERSSAEGARPKALQAKVPTQKRFVRHPLSQSVCKPNPERGGDAGYLAGQVPREKRDETHEDPSTTTYEVGR
jgi:hypothetical protein